MNELSSKIDHFECVHIHPLVAAQVVLCVCSRYDPETGQLTALSPTGCGYSMLPPEWLRKPDDWCGNFGKWAADSTCHPNGKFLYATNRWPLPRLLLLILLLQMVTPGDLSVLWQVAQLHCGV